MAPDHPRLGARVRVTIAERGGNINANVMVPPIWPDESGRPRAVRPCPRRGREAPLFEFSVEQLQLLGWRPYEVASFVNWCGHAQEFIQIPEPEREYRLNPLLGEAT